MEKNPLLSIIIPFYNTGISLEGLLKQLLKVCPEASDKYSKDFNANGFEIICIDDKSSDDSLQRIKKLAKNHEEIQLISLPKNGGSAAARNHGLKQAKGKFICFLDSDDFIDDKFFLKLLAPFKNENLALDICGFKQIYLKQNKVIEKFTNPILERKDKDSWREYILKLMRADGRLYSSVNKLYRGDIIRKFKLSFDPKLNFAEDTKFVLSYLKCFDDDAEIVSLPDALYFYNYGTNTSVVASSSLDWKNWEKSYTDIIEWLASEADNGDRVISRKELKLAKKVKTRFKVSHALSVARSKMSHKEKRKYAGTIELLLAEVYVRLRS